MRFVDSVVYQYRRWRYRPKPVPRIRVTTRRSIPAWAVRILAAVSAFLCVALPGIGSPVPTELVIALGSGLATWMLARPGYEVALTSILMAGLLLFSSSAFHPLTWWILAAAYFSLRGSMVSYLVNWTSKVELRVILTWRDAVIAGVTALIGCAGFLPGSGWWTVLLGAFGLLIVAVFLVILPKARSPLGSVPYVHDD